jgi:Fur family transcriptional regulator, zinc uptake regulator
MVHSHADHRHELPPDLTRNQELVLETLNRAEGPLSAYDILDRLREAGLRAPLQVYRALEKLVDQGLAHRLESVNAFVCCAAVHGHSEAEATTAFAICSDCGRVDEFADKVVADRLRDWAAEQGFTPQRTTIELRGRCRNCTAGRSAGEAE